MPLAEGAAGVFLFNYSLILQGGKHDTYHTVHQWFLVIQGPGGDRFFQL